MRLSLKTALLGLGLASLVFVSCSESSADSSNSTDGGDDTSVTVDIAGDISLAKTVTGASAEYYFTGTTADSAGNVYAVGYLVNNTASIVFDSASFTGPSTGNNAFIVKFNASGVAQWISGPTSGANITQYKDVTIDSSGNICVTGNISGTNQSDFGNSVTLTGKSSSRCPLIVKYTASGSCQWAVSTTNNSVNANNFDYIATDDLDNIYIAGYITGIDTTTFSSTVSASGKVGMFDNTPSIAKFNGAGVAQWIKVPTTVSASSTYTRLAITSSGDAVTLMNIPGTITITIGTGVYATGVAGTSTGCIVTYDSDGNALKAATPASCGYTIVYYGLELDSSDNIYIAGGVTGKGTATATYNLGNDVLITSTTKSNLMYNAFVAKLSSNDSVQWATCETGNVYYSSLSIDTKGCLYAVANPYRSSISTGTSLTFGGSTTIDLLNDQTYQGIVVKYGADGIFNWAKSITAGTDDFYINDTFVRGDSLYVAGYLTGTGSFTFDSTTVSGGATKNGVLLAYN